MKFSGMTIGVPKEIMPGEGRVSSTPETVKKMVAEGATVLVQKTAGEGSFFSDQQYVDAGATLVDGAEEIFAKADVILKVKEPLFNKDVNKHESDMLRDGQYLITFLHPAAPVNPGAHEKASRHRLHQPDPGRHSAYFPRPEHGRPDLHEHRGRVQKRADGRQLPG